MNPIKIPSLTLAAFAVCAAYGQSMVANSAAEAKPLTVGASAPDATLQSLAGKDVKLSSILRRKQTVLIFYRGGWCPYCNRHLSDLASIEKQVTARGYQIIAVSPDTPAELNKTLTKDQLTYRLFSDSSAETMKKFGVAYRLDDPTFNKMRESYGIDLEKYSGQPHHILPVPSVFVIGKDGKITYVHANPDYKVRLKGSELLDVISAK